MNIWTKEEIEQILIQLDQKGLPFEFYSFDALGEGLCVLGSGASATVYRGHSRKNKEKTCAIKVIGFSNAIGNAVSFAKSAKSQMKISLTNQNVVRIDGYVQLRVWIEGECTVSKTELIDEYTENDASGDYLDLRFLLMEEITPVVCGNKYGRPEILPSRLAFAYENEVLKMARDIGTALDKVHREGILHRDIKLENIFYSYKEECYKLGDFGIAKNTDNGMASTVAFTKGYGAPEVMCNIDKYDKTADIYSFGMMLYVLLNDLRFPQSKNYNVNLQEQYRVGYVPPTPSGGSKELVDIVLKMLRYNPNDRYQSMEEVLDELEKLIFNDAEKASQSFKRASGLLGLVLTLLGIVLFIPIPGLSSVARCIPISLFSIGIILIYRYGVFNFNNTLVVKLRKKNILRIYLAIVYVGFGSLGWTVNSVVRTTPKGFDQFFGVGATDFLLSCRFDIVFIIGVVFWTFWEIRKRIFKL